MKHKRILFIHHGGVSGGAPLSMLYTMKGLRTAGYHPLAALVFPSPALHALYNDEGFETVEVPWIPIFITYSASEGKRWNPFMWQGVLSAMLKWKSAKILLRQLIHNLDIDIVHLNSVALSNPASLLIDINFPFVWHVREHGPRHRGKRYYFLRKRLMAAPEIIFLSRAEQRSWIGSQGHGTIVSNFIDFKKFDRALSGEIARKKYEIESEAKVILYVGGNKKHKGIFELLKTLWHLKQEFGKNFVCLMPGSAVDVKTPSRTDNLVLDTIREYAISKQCRLLSFDPNIVDMFAASDVLVFPATKPHFARPIIEAAAMGKPVIASNLSVINELVVEGSTGYLVDPAQSEMIASRLVKLFSDKELCKRLGDNAIIFARKNFEFGRQIKKIEQVYNRILQSQE